MRWCCLVACGCMAQQSTCCVVGDEMKWDLFSIELAPSGGRIFWCITHCFSAGVLFLQLTPCCLWPTMLTMLTKKILFSKMSMPVEATTGWLFFDLMGIAMQQEAWPQITTWMHLHFFCHFLYQCSMLKMSKMQVFFLKMAMSETQQWPQITTQCTCNVFFHVVFFTNVNAPFLYVLWMWCNVQCAKRRKTPRTNQSKHSVSNGLMGWGKCSSKGGN